jgi:hypothetical protein
MKRKLAGAAVTMLVAALAAAGCGSDGDNAAKTATTSGAPLTKAEFIAAADKLCTANTQRIEKAATKLRTAAKKTGTLAVPDVATFLLKSSLPAYDDLLDKLRNLTPPTADQKAIDGLVASLAGAIDTAKADPNKYARNGAPDPFDDANARAKKYGMKVCGS